MMNFCCRQDSEIQSQSSGAIGGDTTDDNYSSFTDGGSNQVGFKSMIMFAKESRVTNYRRTSFLQQIHHLPSSYHHSRSRYIFFASCFSIHTDMENHTFNFNISENINKEDNLEDFEEFDLRDAINVGAYSVMSASKDLFRIYEFSVMLKVEGFFSRR